jgi:hypothetical protein
MWSGTVATFQDPGSTDPPSAYAATIDWGDGTTTAGTITGSNGNYTITGSHTYTDEIQNGAILVTVGEPAANFSLGPVGDALTVTDADPLTSRAQVGVSSEPCSALSSLLLQSPPAEAAPPSAGLLVVPGDSAVADALCARNPWQSICAVRWRPDRLKRA